MEGLTRGHDGSWLARALFIRNDYLHQLPTDVGDGLLSDCVGEEQLRLDAHCRHCVKIGTERMMKQCSLDKEAGQKRKSDENERE